MFKTCKATLAVMGRSAIVAIGNKEEDYIILLPLHYKIGQDKYRQSGLHYFLYIIGLGKINTNASDPAALGPDYNTRLLTIHTQNAIITVPTVDTEL